MHQITCPHCHTTFSIDNSAYAEILSQVRDEAFDKALHERLESAHRDTEIAVERVEASLGQKLVETSAKKDAEISDLKATLNAIQTAHKLELTEAVKAVEDERNDLRRDLQAKDAEYALKEASIKEQHQLQISAREDEIERLRDHKLKLSTKMVGESLEQHCESEFTSMRTSTFPNAYFEKDNDAKSGSKGDFIFRDYDDEENEFISIMFEMKNESDATATKKKNEDFFKELDKDRNQKGCEYAILVSLLEPDNELYNRGIVDVSYRYPKMFVIRPQFFMPMIALLRNAALNSLGYRRELEQMRAENIDIANFESQIEDFKEKFGENYRLSSERFQDAIKEIDKSISALTKVKENLQLSEKHLGHANNKAENLTIKKLTKDAPSLAAKASVSSPKAIDAGKSEESDAST